MASQSVSVFTLPVRLAERVEAHTFVAHDGRPAGAGRPALGAAAYGGDPGDDVAVHVLGTAQLVADDEILAGALVYVGNESGEGRASLTASGYPGPKTAVGRALQGAKAAGDLVEVLLIPN
jgi:hypothetical protein